MPWWGCPAPIGVTRWPFSAVSKGDAGVGGGRSISPSLLRSESGYSSGKLYCWRGEMGGKGL